MFATKAEAKQFVERHARAFVTGEPLTWTDTDNTSALIAQFGDYLVTFIDNPLS